MIGPEHREDHLVELEAVGLLLAGALAPGDRSEVERHLLTCERCRDELVEIAALPGLLRRQQPDVAAGRPGPAPAGPPPAARARLLTAGHTAVRRRTRRRRLLGAAAAVVPLALAVALLGAPGGTTTPAAPALVAMERADPALQVDGALAAEARRWGTSLTLRMTWATTGTATLVAIGRDGTEQTAASWKTTAGAQVLCEGATSLSDAELDRFVVRSGTGADLLVLRA